MQTETFYLYLVNDVNYRCIDIKILTRSVLPTISSHSTYLSSGKCQEERGKDGKIKSFFGEKDKSRIIAFIVKVSRLI